MKMSDLFLFRAQNLTFLLQENIYAIKFFFIYAISYSRHNLRYIIVIILFMLYTLFMAHLSNEANYNPFYSNNS